MANKKKSSGLMMASPSISDGGNKMHMSIDQADNGFIVRIDGHHDGKYHERKLVATSPRQAFRIAAAHMPTMGKKSASKKKGHKGKVFASKKA